MSLTQMTYHSRIAADRGSRLVFLRAILAVSSRNNARDGITGFLLLDEDTVFQILEGPGAAVADAYRRIEADRRHGQVTLLSRREVRGRSFPRWSMGGVVRSLDQQEIFVSHGISGRIDTSRIAAATILALAMDLQDLSAAQALRVAQA